MKVDDCTLIKQVHMIKSIMETAVDRDDALKKDYADAPEAMRILKVRQQTLYAYVSRGWIRSIRQSGRKDRLYLRGDLERMAARSLARSGHGAVAASAMNWGEPIIPTTITEITPQGPSYRGRLAVDLARMRTGFETVAELLWTGLWHEDSPSWKVEKASPELKRLTDALPALRASDQILEVFALVTLHLGIARGTVAERIRGGRTLDAARQIVQTLVGCCGLVSPQGRFVPMKDGQTVVEGLMQALSVPDTAENNEAMESILTLLGPTTNSRLARSPRVFRRRAGGLCTVAWPRPSAPVPELRSAVSIHAWGTSLTGSRRRQPSCSAPYRPRSVASWCRASCTRSIQGATLAGSIFWMSRNGGLTSPGRSPPR